MCLIYILNITRIIMPGDMEKYSVKFFRNNTFLKNNGIKEKNKQTNNRLKLEEKYT